MIICIDIGGGTTRIGFSIDKKTFDKIVKFPTFDDFQDQINRMILEIKNLTPNPEKIIIAAAGAVDRKNGIIIKWGQKTCWWGQKVFKILRKTFPEVKLAMDNDANIGALGEAVLGAGKNYSLVGYVTFSSGIGGCMIVNKKIVDHKFGIEPAHQIVNFKETDAWSCGQKGCFEAYASGTAFKKIFGMPAEKCEDQTVWDRYAKLAAVGIANLLVLWSPEVLVIGGGLSNKFDKFIEPLKKELISLLPIFEVPQIVKSELDEPGLYGGLVLSSDS